MANPIFSLPHIGAVFGKYRIIGELGRGGMAEVFLAIMNGPGQFNKLIALKVLRPEFAEDPEGRTMFLNEARLAARLTHPNIVQTYEIGQAEERYYIAMEYVEGQPFSRVNHMIREKGDGHRLPIPIALYVVSEILTGLQYAHELNEFNGKPLSIVHRDVSPHNIVVTYDGFIKLVDFGIAKAANSTPITRTGILKGKIAYMSPEQMADAPVDRRADIYAAGIVLWEALAGRRLWKGLSDLAILSKITTEGVPTLRSVNPQIPEALEAICMKALAFDPNSRYATAAAFQEAIGQYLRTHFQQTSVREIAQYISSLFKEERKESQRRIEIHIAQSQRSSTTGSITPVSVPIEPTATLTAPSRRFLSLNNETLDAQISSQIRLFKPNWTMRTLIAFVGVTFVGFFLWGVVAKQNRLPSQPNAQLIHANSVSYNANDFVTTPMSLSTASNESQNNQKIRVQIHVNPTHARIFWDQAQLVENPTSLILAQDQSKHMLHIEADGYLPYTEVVSLNTDHAIHVSLQKNERNTNPTILIVQPQPSTSSSEPTIINAPNSASPSLSITPAPSTSLTPVPKRAVRPLDPEDPFN